MPYEPHTNGRPRRSTHQTLCFNIRFTPEERESMRMHAQERGTSVAALAREAMARAGLFSLVPAAAAADPD